MKVLEAYKSKKYLQRILLSMSIIVVLILLVSSSVLHYSSETRALQMHEESNRKVMNQIAYNISYMEEIVSNLAVNLYADEEILPLMLNPDKMSEIRSTFRLAKKFNTSSFLHSIVVSNRNNGKTYAVGDLAMGAKDHDKAAAIGSLLKDGDALPRMQLIPMDVGDDGSIDFFSFVMYESYTEDFASESVLVLNIRPEWIFDNLKTINDFSAPEQSGIFLMDESGRVMLAGDRAMLPDTERLQRVVGERIEGASAGTAAGSDAGQTFGYFTDEIDGKETFVVTYLVMGGSAWRVVGIQPYDVVLGDIYAMRRTSLIVIGSFFLLSVLISVFAAHKLYQPVERMIRQIRGHGDAGDESQGEGKDELSYVTNVYSAMVRKLQIAKDEQRNRENIVSNYYLRRLVVDSPSYSGEELASCVAQNGLKVEPTGPYYLAIVKIDDYAEFVKNTNYNDRSLYLFAISNIAEEICGKSKFACETVDMRSDHLVMLFSLGTAVEDAVPRIVELLKHVQDVVLNFYKLSLSMTLSHPIDRHEDITEQYGHALQYSLYKLIFGRRSIVTPDDLRPNLQHDEYNVPADAEKRLVEGIKLNDLDKMDDGVKRLLEPMASFHYDHIIHGVLHVVDIIKSTIREMNNNRVATIHIDVGSLSRQALEQETLEDIAQLFHHVCREINEKQQRTEQSKNEALIDAIKDIINANFMDMNLSLQGIASLLRMTPAYVGRMFKQSEMISVSEYINEARLLQAREFLETKSYSIKEIMESVGFSNESTFFKLFKKKFGVTPKEYRLKRVWSK
jgi:YesN/AraC family two-component response regulator